MITILTTKLKEITMRTRVVVSFVGEGQLPYLMVTKEYYDRDNKVEFAEIIYQEDFRMSDVAITGDVIIGKSGSDLELFPGGRVIAM